MSTLARRLLIIFGLLGLAASATSSYVHWRLLHEPHYASFCDINTTVSCTEAYLSRYGSIAGVPVALGGVFFFAFVLVLGWAGRRGSRAADSAPAYIFAASTLALAFVLYLGYASFVILKAVCLLCATTYVAVAGVFIVSGGASALPMTQLPSRFFRDLRVLVASPLALVIALLFAGGAVSAVALFPHEAQVAQTPAAAPAQPLEASQQTEFERWWDQQPTFEMPIDNGGAKVLIVKFNDFQCPPCRQTYFQYDSILAKYKDRPQDVKYVLKHFPLNPSCNSSVPNLIHPAACDAAAAFVMAGPKGTALALENWFFTNQERLSPATVKQAAADVGGITDFDAEYARAIQQVKTDASIGGVLGVRSTPTFFVNGRRIVGGLPPQYFQAGIDLELKRAGK